MVSNWIRQHLGLPPLDGHALYVFARNRVKHPDVLSEQEIAEQYNSMRNERANFMRTNMKHDHIDISEYTI